MKSCKFIGLNAKEQQLVAELIQEGSISDGYDILFVGFDTPLDDIQGMFVEFFDEIVLLYSGSSKVSELLDARGIKYEHISRYCDDAVITHQIQKVLELTEGTRDLTKIKFLSWGDGFIANRFKTLFPYFNLITVDPSYSSTLNMSELCRDIDAVLVNHSHYRFHTDWLLHNCHQHNGFNSTIIINSSREGAVMFNQPRDYFPRFYSDVDGANAPHLFFESEDTYNNIKQFIKAKTNEQKNH